MESRNLVPTWITLILAIVLIASPWVLAYPAGWVVGNISIAAAIVGVLAILALALNRVWDGWLNMPLISMVVGAWIFLGPLLFHFKGPNPQTWVYYLGGILVMALAVVQVWISTGGPVRQHMATH